MTVGMDIGFTQGPSRIIVGWKTFDIWVSLIGH